MKNCRQLLPFKGTAELFEDLFSCPLSEGTLDQEKISGTFRSESSAQAFCAFKAISQPFEKIRFMFLRPLKIFLKALPSHPN